MTMAQDRSNVGVLTSIDLVKQGKSHATYPYGMKRQQGQQYDRIIPDRLHSSAVASGHQSHPISAITKRPRLGIGHGQWIEASEICRAANHDSTYPEISEYSQRQATKSTPSPSLNPLLRLSHSVYGLPESLIMNLTALGIDSIYPWQSSCLLGRGILTGERNLVYSAPTGGGKSLVADVLMLKRVIEDPVKKAILVVPYVALVQEKLQWLRKVVDGVGKIQQSSFSQSDPRTKNSTSASLRIAGYFGGTKAFRGAKWSDIDIAVCTFEKVFLLFSP